MTRRTTSSVDTPAYRWSAIPIACLAENDQAPMHDAAAVQSSDNKYKQMFKLRALHLLATFVLIYVGVEVTLGGSYGLTSCLMRTC